MFEPSFRADVLEIDGSLERMIWRVVSRYAELHAAVPTVDAEIAYPLFDGLFQRGLLRLLAGHDPAAEDLEANVCRELDRAMTPGGGEATIPGKEWPR